MYFLLMLFSMVYFSRVIAAGNDCGKQADQYQQNVFRRQRIMHGTDAEPHSWPWVVPIYMDGGLCTGDLVSVEGDSGGWIYAIVTAAHCLYDEKRSFDDEHGNFRPALYPVSYITITAGRHDVRKPERGMQIGGQIFSIKLHPDYKPHYPSMPINDVAVITMWHPFERSDTVRPICLPKKQGQLPPNPRMCVAAGWGTDERGNTRESLLNVASPVLNSSQCGAYFSGVKMSNGKQAVFYDPDRHLCAGSMTGPRYVGVGKGDSGGMLACSDGAAWTLYGVTSFASASPRAQSSPMVFANVSTYANWIKETIEEMAANRKALAGEMIKNGYPQLVPEDLQYAFGYGKWHQQPHYYTQNQWHH